MSQPFVGEIRMFGASFAPAGWAFCNGQLLPISEYETLFSLIGTTYGGDGQTTFALPDLRGRVPVHQTSGYVMGQSGGTETVTLTVQQVPAHSHLPAANSSGANAISPTNAVPGNWGPNGAPYSSAGPTPGIQMNAAALQPAGGSQPHDNMLPYLAISFIISLFGIYPSRS